MQAQIQVVRRLSGLQQTETGVFGVVNGYVMIVMGSVECSSANIRSSSSQVNGAEG